MYGRPHLVRTILLAIVLPLTILAVALARGTASTAGEEIVFGAMGVVMAVVAGIIAIVGSRTELARRGWIGAINGWAVMLALIIAQPRPATGADGPQFTPQVLISGLVAMWLTGLLAGKDPRRPTMLPMDPSLPRLLVRDDQRVGWYARVHPTRGALLSMLVMLGITGFLAWFWWPSVGWWGLTLPAIWLHRYAGDLAWNVRINATGLTARSWLARRPAIVVPADEVLRVDANGPVAKTWFSGPGVTTELDGTITVGLGGSDSITILATGGRRYVLTVPRADEAAMTLTTLADRARMGAT